MTNAHPGYPCDGVCPTAWTLHDVGARNLCGLPGPARLPIAALTIVSGTHPTATDTLAQLPLSAANHVVGNDVSPAANGRRPVQLRYTFTNPHGQRLRIRALADSPPIPRPPRPIGVINAGQDQTRRHLRCRLTTTTNMPSSPPAPRRPP